ncbi:unnamed protein product [Adineta steineri]|uniref:Uncharacterized protein n=1 Tax=Adineta steineri TaxID=433720 RepID=A0A814A9Z4_9BILA|nr:unnamed protein product [Adineta steineri]CAF0842495.1 unnamed protein product [Adineta steineri]CAF0911874.1 unnamed protein product [Adineta steineri]
MLPSNNFQQFQSNPDNQEIINLQNNIASLGKRLDKLQECTSESNDATKIESLQNDVYNLQRQVDNAAKAGRQDVTGLLEKFNHLNGLATNITETLSQKIDNVNDSLQANTNRDNVNECFLHLDANRYTKAAVVADRMTIDAVKKLIRDYDDLNNEYKEDRRQVLSEFINWDQKYVCHPPLPCYGRQCVACGRCCDWYYSCHPDDWKWIRDFRSWDHMNGERWRNGLYYDKFKLKDGAKCTRSTYYGASRFVRIVSFGAFDGSALLGHLCVCDPQKE